MNEVVELVVCYKCFDDVFYEVGDFLIGGDILCDDFYCYVNMKVFSGVCEVCLFGMVNVNNDSVSGGDTTCDSVFCFVYMRV